jgi:hypothetical protein
MSAEDALTLQHCLTAQSWHTLYALSRANAIPFHGQWTQPEAAAALVIAFQERSLAPLLDTLSSEARAALRTLLRAGGQMARTAFIYRFGEFHPYRPWRDDARPEPWTQPRSPTEQLVYRGLIFPLNLGTTERPVHVFALPVDYRAALQAALDIEVQPLTVAQPDAPTLVQHLFAFLSYLNRESVTPLHGRWLAPRHFRALAPFLEPYADPAKTARSELQFRYLAFIHYLAERLGLVDRVAGYLRPTSTAWGWLDTPLQAQYQALWEAWRESSEANRALWHRYRLPPQDEDEPPERLQQLIGLLARHPPEGVTPAAYLDALQTRAPALFRPQTAYQAWAETDADAREAYRSDMVTALEQLLRGPLAWFGAVALADDHVTLTALGAALVGRAEGAWPNPRAPVRLQITTGTEAATDTPALRLHVVLQAEGDEGRLTPARRLALEQFAPPDPEQPGHYTLARAPVQAVLQQGRHVDGLLTLLEQAAGPLPPLVVGACYRWAAEVDRLQVRRITVLEAQDPDLLQDLTAERRIRETLLETLSARAVRVDASQLDALLRRLAYRDLYPRLDLPAPAPEPETDLSAEARITLGAALAVYATLTDRLSADVRPPHTLARQWRRRLTDAERDALERRVETLLDALRQATPSPIEDHLPAPTGEILAVLEQAIAESASVKIRYYTAGRDHVTERRVDPLRLEWRGEVAYLIAYCHLRQAQRVFRVDRIETLRRRAS